jgi:hypothetical protein
MISERWMPNGRKNGKAKKPEDIEKRKGAHREAAKGICGLHAQGNPARLRSALHGCRFALPRQDLAKMAEALVALTAFLMRMTADQEETVAEPIDVALLSKCDGFIWVKHKDLICRGAAGSLD